MVEFSVSEIRYAMYSHLNLDYLYPSLHDYAEFVQLVHCCLPRFQSKVQHAEGTQCILLIWMNALMKKSVSVFICILKNLFFNRALTLLGKWGNLWIICLEKGTHTAMSHTTMRNSQMSTDSMESGIKSVYSVSVFLIVNLGFLLYFL